MMPTTVGMLPPVRHRRREFDEQALRLGAISMAIQRLSIGAEMSHRSAGGVDLCDGDKRSPAWRGGNGAFAPAAKRSEQEMAPSTYLNGALFTGHRPPKSRRSPIMNASAALARAADRLASLVHAPI